jgi:hypothetical protein
VVFKTCLEREGIESSSEALDHSLRSTLRGCIGSGAALEKLVIFKECFCKTHRR